MRDWLGNVSESAARLALVSLLGCGSPNAPEHVGNYQPFGIIQEYNVSQGMTPQESAETIDTKATMRSFSASPEQLNIDLYFGKLGQDFTNYLSGVRADTTETTQVYDSLESLAQNHVSALYSAARTQEQILSETMPGNYYPELRDVDAVIYQQTEDGGRFITIYDPKK